MKIITTSAHFRLFDRQVLLVTFDSGHLIFNNNNFFLKKYLKLFYIFKNILYL